MRDGIIPWWVVTSSDGFAREAFGVPVPLGARCLVSGSDLVRDADGTYRVLEDNLRSPSGISYVVENRVAMTRLLPHVFADMPVRPVDHYGRSLLGALSRVAPAAAGEQPRIVVLTPGVYNSAYFEHVFLAAHMGVELVEGRDLVVDDHVVYMRTTQGLERVDVIYRRIDDAFLDPVVFRPDSTLGVPGLMAAVRSGNVTIANAVGNGVADDKAVYAYVPELIRYYMGEDPILPNVDTYLLWEPDQREHVLERLDQLVVKPVAEAGGYGITIGPTASDEQLAVCREAILADPRGWIAQEVVSLSRHPTLVDDHLEGRHVDLRPFVLTSDTVEVIPGGLTRVAMMRGSLVVNSSQGGGSKDTWVLAPTPEELDAEEQAARAGRPVRRRRGGGVMLARDAESLFWIGRYLERAEDTARLLDVTYHGLLEASVAEEFAAWTGVLAAVGLDAAFRERDLTPTASAVSSFLVHDRRNQGSILSAVEQTRENARTVRELLSTELWEAVNSFCLALRTRDLAAEVEAQPHELYGFVRQHCQTVAGVAAETLARDEGWRFLKLGWNLERAEWSCRLLRVRQVHLASAGFHEWVGTLRSASALEAYRRAHRASMDPADVVGFLLLSRQLPPQRPLLAAHGRAGPAGAGPARLDAPPPAPRRPAALGPRVRRRAGADVGRPRRRAAGGRAGHPAGRHVGGPAVLHQQPRVRPPRPAGAARRGAPREARHPLRHVVHLRRVGEGGPERAAGLSGHRRPPAAHQLPGDDVAVGQGGVVHRLLGHAGGRVRPPPAPRGAGGGRRGDRRHPAPAAAHRGLRGRTRWRTAGSSTRWASTSSARPTPTGARAWPPSARRQAALAGPEVVGTVLALHRAVGTSLRYERGVTDVGVPVEDVLRTGRGVCQDFAHLAVALCRSRGIPARYVSGYLFTRDETHLEPVEELGDEEPVRVQTHAWFEAAVPGWGWLALDPTNQQAVGARHVKIGHGRDYDDVQPLRGVFWGSAAATVQPSVEIRRLPVAEAQHLDALRHLRQQQ